MLPTDDESSPHKWDEILFTYRIPILFLLTGVILIGIGIFTYRYEVSKNDEIKIIDGKENQVEEIVVEIAGAVKNPGVYKLPSNARVNDLLTSAGGFSDNYNSDWVDKYINKASLLSDGQKLYIPSIDEQPNILSANTGGLYQNASGDNSGNIEGLVNINISTQEKLEELVGIGPVYAQKIVEHRPYSKIEDLLSKSVIPKSTYEIIKDDISVY